MITGNSNASETERSVPDDRRGPERTAAVDDTAHAFLRAATHVWHERVEEGFAPLDLQEVGGLTQFLRRQAAALLPLERELETRAVEEILPDWPERRRSDALQADLLHLGAAPLDTSLRANLSTHAERLGALYVLEGSRLGGRMLCRRVLGSADPRTRAAVAYLSHSGPRQGWRVFLDILNATGSTHDTRAGLLAGAEQAFGLFHAGASLAFDGSSLKPLRSDLVHTAYA